MTQQMTYRVAVPDDEAGILKVFAEVAAEVPTAVRPQTAGLVHDWVTTGASWVAIDSKGTVVGYALAMPVVIKEAVNNVDAISLIYLGVAKAARNQRICSTIVSKLQEKGAPIIAAVRNDNTSLMAERFKRLGFAQVAVGVDETKFRWDRREPPG